VFYTLSIARGLWQFMLTYFKPQAPHYTPWTCRNFNKMFNLCTLSPFWNCNILKFKFSTFLTQLLFSQVHYMNCEYSFQDVSKCGFWKQEISRLIVLSTVAGDEDYGQ
jgi:hypothetical protein